MLTLYDSLKIEYGACPPDCFACQETCAAERGKARIRAIRNPGFSSVTTCNQCANPKCTELCPTGAITKATNDGIVRLDDAKCVGCGLCTLACPYGGVFFDLRSATAVKCDLCDGKPACVKACKYGILSFISNRSLDAYLEVEDRFFPGSSLCAGCTAELGLRLAMRVLGKDYILGSAASCSSLMLVAMADMVACKVPNVFCSMTSTPAVLAGIKRYYEKIGRDVKVVAYLGDGSASDAGFQSLSGAAERGEKMICICYDNEAYMNTGIQRSGTTPLGAWTNTSPVGKLGKGKDKPSKYMPLVMAFHGIPYVATATVAFLEDYFQKLAKAKEAVKEGLVYIHLLVPCPTGWRAPADSVIELSRMAVETNYFPLWETEGGKFRLTYRPREPKPVREFTKMMGRFSHLDGDGLQKLQEFTNSRFALIEALTRI